MVQDAARYRRLPWLLGVGAALVYLSTSQRQLYNDGIFFHQKLALGGEALLYNHLLYLPLVKLLQVFVSLVYVIDGEQAMKLLAAIAGGTGVGLTYVIARERFAEVKRAVACALLLASLAGYWFHSTVTELHSLHAACSSVLLLALFRVLDAQELGSAKACVLLAAGALLTPASHLSGVCVGLPLLYVFFRAGPARARFTIFGLLGVAVFAVVYYSIITQDHGFTGYTKHFGGHHSVLWTDPARVPGLLLRCMAEFALFAAPAASFIPAGLRLMFRESPKHAWFCISWMLAWPLAAWPIADRVMGSYFVPTFPVQAILAIVAARVVCRTWGRAILVAGLAITPDLVLVFFQTERLALLILVVGAAMIWGMVGSAAARTAEVAGRFWILPITAFLITSPHIINVMRLDPQRDRIAAVSAVVQKADRSTMKRSLLIFLETQTGPNQQWKRFFPGAYADETRAFNPIEALFDYEPARHEERLELHLRRIESAFRSARPVFLTGSLTGALEAHPELRPFFDKLNASYAISPTALAGLYRLRPRDQ